LQKNHGEKDGHVNKFTIKTALGAPCKSTWEMPTVGKKQGKDSSKRQQATSGGATCWWDVKEKRHDSKGQPFQKTMKADIKR